MKVEGLKCNKKKGKCGSRPELADVREDESAKLSKVKNGRIGEAFYMEGCEVNKTKSLGCQIRNYFFCDYNLIHKPRLITISQCY